MSRVRRSLWIRGLSRTWVLGFCLVTIVLWLGCEDDGAGSDFALVSTSMGYIGIEMFPDSAPLAVQNFEGLARRGYFDGTIFHRVIANFFIQGGDSTGTGYNGESIWGEPFADEFDASLRFDRFGRVGMANSGPNTNKSQFFIALVPSPHLNDRHTIFAQVVNGEDVVEAIGEVDVDSRDRPIQPVIVERVRIMSRRELDRYFGGDGSTP